MTSIMRCDRCGSVEHDTRVESYYVTVQVRPQFVTFQVHPDLGGPPFQVKPITRVFDLCASCMEEMDAFMGSPTKEVGV